MLVRAEYDVALLGDHAKALRLINHFPSSILFCNIDDSHQSEVDWQEYARGIVANQAKNDARIGILTYDPQPEMASTYLMDIGVPCGYIGLKLGLSDSAKIILRTLEANEAKGGRRFVRVKCPAGKAVISINVRGHLYKGTVIDLSSAGIACVFEASLSLKPGAVEEDIQMQLWGAIVRVSMTYMGSREQEGFGTVCILMFEVFKDLDSKSKLFSFIRKSLQAEIDQLSV